MNTHMHFWKQCIWLYFAVHICMYLYVSVCIWRSHTNTYVSNFCFSLLQIGRPQQRDARESVRISSRGCRSRTRSTSASIVIPQQSVHRSVTFRIVLFQTHSCFHWMLCTIAASTGCSAQCDITSCSVDWFIQFDCLRTYKSCYISVLRNSIQ